MMLSFYIIALWVVSMANSQSSFPCPDPAAITPCICTLDSFTNLMTLDCSDVANTNELLLVFKASFPFLHFGKFLMINDPATPSGVDALPDGLFNNITFDVIDIQNAMIETMGTNLFEKSYDTLQLITVEGTQLIKFPFDHLSSFTKIVSINVQNNSLTNMADLYSSTLSYLNVAHNGNLFFSETDFVNVGNLTYLDLSYTGQKVIPVDAFVNLMKLAFIDLKYNSLNVLETSSINLPSNSLSTLDVSNNRMSLVQEGAIQGLNPAASLFFQHNSISTLFEHVWRPIFEDVARTSTTGQIDLEDNPLDCTCNIAWLVLNDTLRAEISPLSACANGGPNIIDLDANFYSVNC